MSFLGLNIAGSALEAFQEAENVTAQNIANVQTPGASRQLVHLGQAPPIDGNTMFPNGFSPGTQGTGILVTSIMRVHQDSYDALFRGATSSENYYNAEDGILSGLQASFGEPHGGVNAAYTRFQTAIQTLVNNPQGIAERNGLLTAAHGVVTALNGADAAIGRSETQTQTQAASLIATINTTLDGIAALNGRIRAATSAGDNPNTYEDQRDELIDTLSTYVDTATSVQADGSTLVTIGGLAVVNDTVAYHLAAPIVGTNANGTPALQVDFVTPPNPVNPPAIPITGGQLGGLLDVYNKKLLVYGAELDDFASGLASETDRISQAGYDLTGAAGSQLFTPVVSQLPVSAGNIQVGITAASEVPAALASTAAGTLVAPLNAGNSTVDTTVALTGNATLRNPPAAALAGTLTIAVDGVSRTFAYGTGAAGNAATIDGFINSFNAGHFGVSASFDTSAQTIVFTRDPSNIDLVHRAAMAAALPPGTTTPDFTLTDGNGPQGPPFTLGTPATSLLAALGANAIDGVNQNAGNAFGATSGGNANALRALFSASFGVPALQTTSPVAAGAGLVTIAVAGAIDPGDVLTIDAGTASAENVTVSAVNRLTGTISFLAKNAHAANFPIASAQTQTLGQSYANLIARMGLDAAGAIGGSAAQSQLAGRVNQVRQSTDGINIDEETQNLIKYQNAYGASAHVIAILNAMLRDAINLGSGAIF